MVRHGGSVTFQGIGDDQIKCCKEWRRCQCEYCCPKRFEPHRRGTIWCEQPAPSSSHQHQHQQQQQRIQDSESKQAGRVYCFTGDAYGWTFPVCYNTTSPRWPTVCWSHTDSHLFCPSVPLHDRHEDITVHTTLQCHAGTDFCDI